MARLKEALALLTDYKTVRRTAWNPGRYILVMRGTAPRGAGERIVIRRRTHVLIDERGTGYNMSAEDMHAEDWEEVVYATP